MTTSTFVSISIRLYRNENYIDSCIKTGILYWSVMSGTIQDVVRLKSDRSTEKN